MKVLLTIGEGNFEVADEQARAQCRQARLSRGETVEADITRVRNPRQHRAAHRFGQLCCENIPQFAHLDAHSTLKRIQGESGVGCETVTVTADQLLEALGRRLHQAFGAEGDQLMDTLAPMLEGLVVEANKPKSLSFQSMDDTEFRQVFSQLATYLSHTYWRELSPERIADMVGIAPEPVTEN